MHIAILVIRSQRRLVYGRRWRRGDVGQDALLADLHPHDGRPAHAIIIDSSGSRPAGIGAGSGGKLVPDPDVEGGAGGNGAEGRTGQGLDDLEPAVAGGHPDGDLEGLDIAALAGDFFAGTVERGLVGVPGPHDRLAGLGGESRPVDDLVVGARGEGAGDLDGGDLTASAHGEIEATGTAVL